MGISGNERADSAAKAALQKDVFDCLISYTDAYQYISQYVCDLWQSEWDTAVNNKLHAIKPLIGQQSSAYRSERRDEVVFSRLKLGHSYLAHSYLLKGEPPPECATYNRRLTISHILVNCLEYDFFRLILSENNFTPFPHTPQSLYNHLPTTASNHHFILSCIYLQSFVKKVISPFSHTSAMLLHCWCLNY